MERVQTPSESHLLSTCFLRRGKTIIKQVLEKRLRLTGDDFRMRVSFTLAGRARPSPNRYEPFQYKITLLLELLPTPKEDVLNWPPLSALSSS